MYNTINTVQNICKDYDMYDRKRKKSSNNNITNRQIDSIGSLEPSERKKERKKKKTNGKKN